MAKDVEGVAQQTGNIEFIYERRIIVTLCDMADHVLSSIEGHLISGYSDGGDDPTKRLSLVPGAFEDADHFLEDQSETRLRFDRVAELVDGFETPYGLELLSTVYWVATNEDAQSLSDLQSKLYAWNERKKQFTPDQIALALKVLIERGWVDRKVHVLVPSSKTATGLFADEPLYP